MRSLQSTAKALGIAAILISAHSAFAQRPIMSDYARQVQRQ